LCPADRAAFQTYRSIPGLGQYQGWSPVSDAAALQFLTEMNQAPMFTPGAWIQLGIAEPESDVLVGDIGLYLSGDGSTGEVGFTLDPAVQGRGIAARAVREALQLLFALTEISQVMGITDARNLPSIRLLERLGFMHIETREVVFRGEPCSEKIYRLQRTAAGPVAMP
jgi:RimJ/RimL family protein N-acetyltransferase